MSTGKGYATPPIPSVPRYSGEPLEEDRFDELPEADELDFEHATQLFTVDSGGACHWVSAENPARALELIGEVDDWQDYICSSEIVIKVSSLEEANKARFFGANNDEGQTTRMSHEFNRDPSERLVACSEF